MKLNTSSSVISFVRKLEENSIKFYEDLAQRYTESREIFLSFVKENKKNITFVQRTYREGITDVIEGCFSFEGLDTDNYMLKAEIAKNTSYSDLLKMAIEMEEKIQNFYLDTAEKSKSLMADIPRVFERIAQKRDKRKRQLKSLYNKSMEN